MGVCVGGTGWATVRVITVPTATLSPAWVWSSTVFSGRSLGANVVSVRSPASASTVLASDQSLSTTSGTSTLPLETSRTTAEPSSTVLWAAGDVRTTSPLSTSGSSTVLVSLTVRPWLRNASRAAASLNVRRSGSSTLPGPEDTTMVTWESAGRRSPAGGSWSKTVFLAEVSVRVETTGLNPASLSLAIASSRVMSTTLGTAVVCATGVPLPISALPARPTSTRAAMTARVSRT